MTFANPSQRDVCQANFTLQIGVLGIAATMIAGKLAMDASPRANQTNRRHYRYPIW